MTMGEKIKSCRTGNNFHGKTWSQEELGKALTPPVNRAAVNKWETGQVENIKRTHIQQLSELFGISPCDLMCFDSDTNTVSDTKQNEVLAHINLGNKEIMAKNIRYFMKKNDVTQTDICKLLNFPAATFSDWINAKSYPRIDKIELLANYFGISKSALVEEYKASETPKILQDYEKLNDNGKIEAEKRVEELTYIPRYTKEIPDYLTLKAAHAIEGASDEDKQHDYDIMNDKNF